MGQWVPIQTAGSNFFPKSLFIKGEDFSTAPDNEVDNQVVTFRPGLGNGLRVTSSYQNAGAPSDGSTFFPANTNASFYALSSQDRTISIRNKDASGDDGAAQIFFLTSASATTSSYNLRIRRNGGENGVSNIVHGGGGDIILKVPTSPLTSSISGSPNLVFTDNNPWTNLSNLVPVTGQISASLSPGTYNDAARLFLYPNPTVQTIDLPLNTVIRGIEITLNARMGGNGLGAAQFQLALQQSINNVLSSENTILLSPAIVVTGGTFTEAKFGDPNNALTILSPQPGNDVIYLSDIVDVWGSIQIAIKNLVTTNIFEIAGGTLGRPQIKFYYENVSTSTKIVGQAGETNFSVDHANGAPNTLMNLFQAPTISGLKKIYVAINPLTNEFLLRAALPGVDPNSTKRIKTNIKTFSSSLVDNFNKLRPVTYQHTDRPQDQSIYGGFIVEEIALISPSSVIYGPNYSLNSLNQLDPTLPLIDSQKVPANYKNRDIIAACVAKLQQLDKELNYL